MRMQLSILLTLLCLVGYAQKTIQPRQLVSDAHRQGKTFQTVSIFEPELQKREVSEALQREVGAYDLLRLRSRQLGELLSDAPETLEVPIPRASRSPMTVELIKVNPFASGFVVRESGVKAPVEVRRGLHYRGVIQGASGSSVVALSFFEEEVMGVISSEKLGNLVIGKMSGREWQGEHILYQDDTFLQRQEMYCGTPDSGEGYRAEELQPSAAARSLDDCVGIYFEVDHDIFNDKGGTNGAVNYVSGIFNEVAALYAAEDINIEISEIFVWSDPSPYSGSSSSQLLNQFQSFRNNFNGDLAQLLSYQASGGIAVVNGLCKSNPAFRMSFSSIGSSYNPVPSYSFTVMVVAHEFGHLFGSQHTHACVWNGNNTAIDGCAGFTEGGCPNPGVPSNGGTIMSYCHLTSSGINFSRGFGDQPGNLIRNRTANASCLQACSDDGGGDDDGNGGDNNCTGDELRLNIVLDNYGTETTWQLTDDATGQIVASGGPYSNGQPGTQVTETICVDSDCYTFEMLDNYGDGICCGYGNGRYELRDPDGNILASGSDFGASDVTSFCLSDGGGDDGGDPPVNDDCEGTTYYFALQLDDFGSETTWKLLNSSGSEISQGGPYNDKEGGQEIRDTFCVPNDCYTLQLFDEYGDGICCEYGEGDFQLVKEDGSVVASGGDFGASNEVEFCADGDDGSGGGSCVDVNFNEYPVISYGGNQDRGSATVTDNGEVVTLNNNAWKAVSLSYNITPNTVLEFDFKSTREGEIHGIGFDDDNSISSSFTFRLYGTQNWGIGNFDDYPGGGDWKSYTIPVGQFYTGEATLLTFVGDHDTGAQNADAHFRNVRIHEGSGCSQTDRLEFGTQNNLPAKGKLKAYPNPVNQLLQLEFQDKQSRQAQLEVYDLQGKRIEARTIRTTEGWNRFELSTGNYAAGTYMIRLRLGSLNLTRKISVVRN